MTLWLWIHGKCFVGRGKALEPLSCLKCNAPLQENDFNAELGVARCRYCDNWFKIDNLKKSVEEIPSSRVDVKDVENIPVPNHIRITESPDQMKIVIKTPRLPGLGMGLGILSIFPMMFLGFMSVMILVSPLPNLFAIVPLLMGGMTLLAGMKMKSFTGQLLKDREIEVARGGMLTCSGSLFQSGQEPISVRLIEQLYCTEVPQHFRYRQRSFRQPGSYFNLNALTTDQRSHVLLYGFTNKQEAVLIERRIEDFLGLADRRVAGEAD